MTGQVFIIRGDPVFGDDKNVIAVLYFTYFFGPTAHATFDGRVHGVVVHTRSLVYGSFASGNTVMDGL